MLTDHIVRRPRALTEREKKDRDRAKCAGVCAAIERRLKPVDAMEHRRGVDMSRQLKDVVWGRFEPSYLEFHRQLCAMFGFLDLMEKHTRHTGPLHLGWFWAEVRRLKDDLRAVGISLFAAEAGAVAYIEETLAKRHYADLIGNITYDEVRRAICDRIGSGFDSCERALEEVEIDKTGCDAPGRVP